MANPTKITRYGASEEQIESLMHEWNEPKYRAEQIWACLYRPDPLSEATTLPAALKNRLVDALPLALDEMTVVHGQDGMTSKWLCALQAEPPYAYRRKRVVRWAAHFVLLVRRDLIVS